MHNRMTTREVCEYAGVSRQTLTRWKAMGLLPEPIAKTSHGSGVVNYYESGKVKAAIDAVKKLRGEGWSFPAIVAAHQGDEKR